MKFLTVIFTEILMKFWKNFEIEFRVVGGTKVYKSWVFDNKWCRGRSVRMQCQVRLICGVWSIPMLFNFYSFYFCKGNKMKVQIDRTGRKEESEKVKVRFRI